MSIRPNDRALLTGAASGLGLALTRLLAARGCAVVGACWALRNNNLRTGFFIYVHFYKFPLLPRAHISQL